MCSAESTSTSNFLLAQHFQISSYDDVWPMIQLLSKYSLNSVMDLSCQKRWTFMFSAHDLKLPDTCMLVVYFFREMASMISRDFPPRFIFWRRSAVVACSAASDLCTCCSCADIVTKAFAISSCDIVAPPLRLPLVYNLDPWMML